MSPATRWRRALAAEAGRLAELYYEVRAGLGFNKSPAEYGAFPTDPYPRTPGRCGAQQPGMTGQAKDAATSASLFARNNFLGRIVVDLGAEHRFV